MCEVLRVFLGGNERLLEESIDFAQLPEDQNKDDRYHKK